MNLYKRERVLSDGSAEYADYYETKKILKALLRNNPMNIRDSIVMANYNRKEYLVRIFSEALQDEMIGAFYMIQLSTYFSDEEKEILSQYAGSAFEVLSYVEGDSYVLSERGEYCYNECFDTTNVEFFAQQKYEKIVPYRIIKFYQYYLMNTKEETGSWYRGHQDNNGNWEYDCVSDSLEEAFECL